ncbi:hypothetical protein INT47_002483 [Mucor saturninus]|uniref:Uncharacterized protein n=1 Tax=Mucor saturninus TaxID=64648 RepID=A0A8H7RJ14_9FUNG|nr:hypothetical protein INT47_002483 [Mucor saturninus]
MRFFLLLSTAIASVLAIPSASLVAEKPQSTAWKNIKVALPDGAFFDDRAAQREPALMAIEEPAVDDSDLGYKNLQFTNHIKITLLPPSEQDELNEINDAVHAEKDFEVVQASNPTRRYKKFNENGESPVIRSVEPSGVHQKKVVGMDLNGQMKYLEIPYYNRATIIQKK